jgi:hypothetical protein
MLFNPGNQQFKDNEERYNLYEDNQLRCYYTGSFYITKLSCGQESITKLISEYKKNFTLNYYDNYGAYRIILIDKTKNEVLFFSDNAGLCCFYYNPETRVISDSFLELVSNTTTITPDYEAITEFLHFNYICSNHTICNEIKRTEALCTYTSSYYQESRITCSFKGISISNHYTPYKNMHEMMQDVVYAYKGMKIVNIITGGQDSRTVLSHLHSLGVDYTLAISGDSSTDDVKIAKEISRKLKKQIIVSDQKLNNTNGWLIDLFRSTDGVVGTFTFYRLHKLFEKLKNLGTEIEFGGLCGEHFKNSYINQDFLFHYNSPILLKGKLNKKKFYNKKLNSKIQTFYLSNRIKQLANEMGLKIIDRLFPKIRILPRHKIYFEVGTYLQRYRMISISNGKSFHYKISAPLAEPNLYQLVYDIKPSKLQMGRFQRYQVSKYLPEISSFPTPIDHYYSTLINNNFIIIKERWQSYFLSFLKLIKRNLPFVKQSILNDNLESLIEGRKSHEFVLAMEKCKDLDILDNACDIKVLSDTLADRLMTIGLVFLKYQNIGWK